jgi:serine/threonine-protein kinase HSL1, negative regulator of Swe1 kinase
MSHSHSPRVQTRRSPLGDVTRRVNNGHYAIPPLPNKESFSLPHCESQTTSLVLPVCEAGRSTRQHQRPSSPRRHQPPGGSPGSTAANPRLSEISKDSQIPESNRNSQISTTSTNASGRRKILIGPWHLGKTLGKGATARVRLARHAVTGQLAAIKIVQKKDAQLSQAGSLAALDQKDASMENPRDGARKMPYGIEREVAIMKLIQHPHIMKLYDIWENRTEMYKIRSNFSHLHC